MDLVVPRNRELPDVLSRASSAELNVLADLITDFGKGRVALDDLIRRHILAHREMGSLQTISDVLAREICAYGGNTIANTWRKGGVPYQELSGDVAQKLGGKLGKNLDVFAIEEVAIAAAVERRISNGKTVALPQKATDLATILEPIIASLVSNAGTIAGVAVAGGATGLFAAIGGRLVSLAAPPVAIATATATILEAASPAYRVTVPAVLQIAKIRRVQFDADLSNYREALLSCK